LSNGRTASFAFPDTIFDLVGSNEHQERAAFWRNRRRLLVRTARDDLSTAAFRRKDAPQPEPASRSKLNLA
jgi:hypothetical protein